MESMDSSETSDKGKASDIPGLPSGGGGGGEDIVLTVKACKDLPCFVVEKQISRSFRGHVLTLFRCTGT